MTFSSDRLANAVLASAMVSTHGPSVGLQRAWALPVSPLMLSSGFCGAFPPIDSPNGDACAIAFS